MVIARLERIRQEVDELLELEDPATVHLQLHQLRLRSVFLGREAARFDQPHCDKNRIMAYLGLFRMCGRRWRRGEPPFGMQRSEPRLPGSFAQAACVGCAAGCRAGSLGACGTTCCVLSSLAGSAGRFCLSVFVRCSALPGLHFSFSSSLGHSARPIAKKKVL